MREDALKLLKEKSYFKDGEKTWEDICDRVAKAIASVENKEENKSRVEEEVYSAMSNMDFIFSTPTLLNADEKNCGNLSSCFVLDVKDTIEDICRLDAQFAKIFQKNGGAGTDLSVLRPAKASVNTSNGYAGGVITFMEKFDATADQMTKFNPSRKGALKCNLNVFHPQIQEFIHCKDDLAKLNRMNISVSLSDKFMNAVANDDNWDLKFPDYEKCKDLYNSVWDGDIEKWESNEYPVKIYKTIKAKQLMKEIAESAWNTGEPGLNYSDRMNRDNPNKHIYTQVYTNPCSEFSAIPYSSCNLGSINLLNCVINGKFDYEKLTMLVRKAVRWFDNMIAINNLPLPEIERITKGTRPIGIGYMGFADTLYALGIKYNSPEGLDFAEKISTTVMYNAGIASVELAKERGVYSMYEGSEWEKKSAKIRNSTLISVAPNGTIAFLADVNGGIEPVYGLVYNRRTYDGTIYYVVNNVFKSKLKELGIYSDVLLEKISNNGGSCQGIKEIPKQVQDIFVTASDISPKDHVDTVAIIQNRVDLSISKTVNFSKKATVQDLSNIFVYAWEKGLKGITVYRDGCRENQTLSTASTYEKKDQEKDVIQYDHISPVDKDDLGETYGTNVKKKVACGNLYINLCRNDGGDLVETFINTGKGGICQSNINALSRLVSVSLRSGIKVEAIIDQLSGIKCPACTILKSQGKDVNASCPDAIANYLREKYDQGDIVIKETKPKSQQKKDQKIDPKLLCPNCGDKMKMESGCVTCGKCGFSRCS